MTVIRHKKKPCWHWLVLLLPSNSVLMLMNLLLMIRCFTKNSVHSSLCTAMATCEALDHVDEVEVHSLQELHQEAHA